MTIPIPTSNHNEALSGDTLYSAFLNYEWRQIVVPYIVRGMEEIARTISDESERQAFEVLYGAMIEDFYNEDVVDGTPVGSIVWFPGITSKIPTKWLKCNGSTYSSATYPELWEVLRDKFSAGGTNFNVPNLSTRFLYGASIDADVSGTAGQAAVALTTSELPSHSHVQRGRNSPAGGVNQSAVSVNVASTTAVDTVTTTGNTGDGVAHDNMPPYMRGYWIIKALP